MQIGKNIYKLSGVEYGTNSNIYAVKYDNGILLFDCGEGELQWNIMQNAMKDWELSIDEVTHVFLTHTDNDHCANAIRLQRLGAKIVVGSADAKRLREGGTPMSKVLHGEVFEGCIADEMPQDGEIYEFPGASVEVMFAPGHSDGSLNYIITVCGRVAVATGDNFEIGPLTARNDIVIYPGNTASPSFNKKSFTQTFRRMTELHAHYILPGHYYTFTGDCHEVFNKADTALKKYFEEGRDVAQRKWIVGDIIEKLTQKGYTPAQINEKLNELGFAKADGE